MDVAPEVAEPAAAPDQAAQVENETTVETVNDDRDRDDDEEEEEEDECRVCRGPAEEG